jgi:eukaryotic-like serine/threonine-protein kinase
MSGDAIGHYKIIDRMGAGALGEVYRARDTRLGRTVAIKILPPDLVADTERVELFLNAARAAAALSHPGIAALFEIGEDGSRRYLVYEFVPGETLHAVINGRPLNARRAIDFGVQLADALADAHASEIVHGDIRPDTIIVNPKEHAKFTDFGLSEFTAGGTARRAAASLVASGGVLAPRVAPYLSPEQVLGDRTDARSDIFSLGLVLFEMLTGRPPFQGSTPAETALQIVQAATPLPSQVNPAIPRELDRIVVKALVKSLDARYLTAATLAAELRSIGAMLDIRAATSEAEAEPAPVSRRGMRGAVLALLIAAVVAGGAWMWRDDARRAWRRWFGPFPAPVLAVVPLQAADGLPRDSRYYTDGLTDDLVTRLGLTPGMTVLGRSRLRQQPAKDPVAAARDAGAGVALSGFVRTQGDEITITVELADAADGARVWQRSFTRPRAQLLALHAEIADAIAVQLRLVPVGSAAKERAASRIVDPAAYDLYLRGRDAAARRDFARAADFFARATDTDSGFAEAQAGLAAASFHQMAATARLDDAGAWARLRRAAESAVTADPDLPDAELAAGLAAPRLGDALAALRRAVALDPSNGVAYREIGRAVAGFDPERALAFHRRALALDRGLVDDSVDASDAYVLLGRLADAERELERGRAVDTANVIWPAGLARIRLAQGRMDAAGALLAPVVSKPSSPMIWLTYVRVLRGAGDARAALAEAARQPERYPNFCEGSAVLAALRFEAGQRGEARQAAAVIIDEAGRRDAPTAVARCAALAAAALQDADAAAAWLRRIGENEEALRLWALPIDGVSGQGAFRLGWYPWGAIKERAPIRDAAALLDRAYARMRSEAANALAGLLPDSTPD